MQIASADVKFQRMSKILLNMPGKKYLVMLSSKDIAIITLIDKTAER